MEPTWVVYATALALGAAHALEVDHMVAVTTFVGTEVRWRSAVLFGIRWGLGHSLVVMILGSAVAGIGLAPSGPLVHWGEVAIGVTLVVLGLWALRAAGRLHLHDPHQHEGHAHLHAHETKLHPHSHDHADPARRHRHFATVVGAVHGLVGTVPVVALLPVALTTGWWSAFTYLVAFGIGTTVAMAVYALLAALAVARASGSVRAARGVGYGTALASMAIGGWWVARAVATLTGR